MPSTQISMRVGKPETYRKAILDGLYRALRDELGVPDGDQFMTITEHDASNFRYGNAFGVARSDDLIYVRITIFDTRSIDQKRALFQRIAELLEANPGIRGEDIFINIYDTPKENWSVGHGDMQFGPGRRSHG